MRSAIDTNVISALWASDTVSERAEGLLLSARRAGGLVICGPVYAELLAGKGITVEFADEFLTATGIDVEPEMEKDIWVEAGVRFSQYARRRKQSKGDQPRRVLADFAIGAHAFLRADRLLTFNPKDYRADFPDVILADSLPQ